MSTRIQRMNFTTIHEMEELGATMMLDGIIEGLPIAKNVKLIIEQAVMFGRDEAGRSDRFYMTVRYDNIDDLIRDAVRNTVNDMFGGAGIDKVAHAITLAGMAYGFQKEQEAAKTNAFCNNYPEAEAALQAIVTAQNANRTKRVNNDLVETFFAEVIKLPTDAIRHFVRCAFIEHRIAFDQQSVPSFAKFRDQFPNILD